MVEELNESDLLRINMALKSQIELLRIWGQDILASRMTETMGKVNAILNGEMHIVQG